MPVVYWIRVACSHPLAKRRGGQSSLSRGINIAFERVLVDICLVTPQAKQSKQRDWQAECEPQGCGAVHSTISFAAAFQHRQVCGLHCRQLCGSAPVSDADGGRPVRAPSLRPQSGVVRSLWLLCLQPHHLSASELECRFEMKYTGS